MEKNNNNKKTMSRRTFNGFRGSRETLKKKTILLFFLIVFLIVWPLFLSNFSFFSLFSHGNKIEGVDIENDKFDDISTPITPKTSASIFENLTINSGNELFENRNYDFNCSFYDSTNKTKEFTAAELQTKLIGDDTIFNDSISNLNNSETQVALNTSITMINGTSDFANNMTLLDDYYTTFNSTEAGHYPATYSFRDDADGSNPNGWSVDLGGGTGTINVKASEDSHRKVVEIKNNLGTQDLRLYQALDDKTSGTVEFYARVEQNNKWFWIRIWDAGQANSLQLAFSSVGVFKYYSGAGWQALPVPTAYVVNTWYHIKIVFDCVGTWTPHIDGASKGACAYRGNPAAMDHIQFAGIAETSTQQVDAIGYSWDSNYDIGDNLNMIPSELNFTLALNFANYNKDLLALEVFAYYYTSILQLINFSIFNFTSNNWFLINSSINNVDFYLSYYMNDTNAFNDFFNSSGSIILNFYGVNTTTFFQLFLDYCAVKIYYKLELGISKSFNIKGNWKYRFHIVGSDYYSSWIYFEVIEFIDLNNYVNNITASSIINKMLYLENFSRITIEGFLNSTVENMFYIVGIKNISFYECFNHHNAEEPTYHYNYDITEHIAFGGLRTFDNDGEGTMFETKTVLSNSYFSLNGIFKENIGNILPRGSIWKNTIEDERIYITFFCFTIGNESNIKYFEYNSDDNDVSTKYYLETKSPLPVLTKRDDLYLFIGTGYNNGYGITTMLFNGEQYEVYFPKEYVGTGDFTTYLVNHIDATEFFIDGHGHTPTDDIDFIQTHMGDIDFYIKDFMYLPEFLYESGNPDFKFECKKTINLWSRDEIIDPSKFTIEFNASMIWNAGPNTDMVWSFNLTNNYFYCYPAIEFQYYITDPLNRWNCHFWINVYHKGELIETHEFNWDYNETIDIILLDEYNPKSIYFGLFNYDGLGLSGDLFRFYINGNRKDFGFNEIGNSYVNLRVLDYFNATLLNQNVNLSSYSEYNMIIEVYTMIIFNNYSHEIKLEIERNNIEIELSIEAGSFSSPYRFLPNIEYELRAYRLNGTLLEEKTILLEDQVQIVSFGWHEIEVPIDPETITRPYENIIFLIFMFVGGFVIVMGLYVRMVNKYKKIPKYTRDSYKYKKKTTTSDEEYIK